LKDVDDLKAVGAGNEVINGDDYESDDDEFEVEKPHASHGVTKFDPNKPPVDSEAESNQYTESENNINFIDDQNAGGYKVDPEPSSDDYEDEQKVHKEDSELEESEDKNKDFIKNYGNDSDEDGEDDNFGKGYHRQESSDEEKMVEQQQQQDQSGTFEFTCDLLNYFLYRRKRNTKK
jgi:hypothetical protein